MPVVRLLPTLAVSLLAWSAPPLLAQAAAIPADVELRPVAADGAVTAIDVRMTIGSADQPLCAGADFSLAAPIVYAGVDGIADRMQAITLIDGEGPVTLTIRDDAAAPGGFPYFRHFTPSRPVGCPFTLTYRALVQPAGGRNGPPFGIRAVGGGLAGAGSGFLLVPGVGSDVAARVHWDLSGLGAPASAASTFGDGDFSYRGPVAGLMQGWYMAGPLGRYPTDSTASGGLHAYWLGTPVFDAPRDMAWTARAYAYLKQYFAYLEQPEYRVFMRFLEVPPYGGATALDNSFMLSRGPLKPGEAAEAPRSTLFHEMIHQWVGGVDAPQGVSSWFSEGLTTYYEYVLPYRGGFIDLEAYRDGVNRLARDYYTNPARGMSAAEITKVGFGDERIRHLPYQRGAFYFADLDARIRARTGGQHNLETLLFRLFREREAGRKFDHGYWIDAVSKILGKDEGERFNRVILQGEDIADPASDAFGPCLEKVRTEFAIGSEPAKGYAWEITPGANGERCRSW